MDTRFQTSFIPKKPVDTGAIRSSGDVNFFLLLSIIILIITAAATGGVFLYKISLTQQVKEKDAQLKQAQESFGLERIKYLQQRSAQLSAAKALLDNHVAPTALFAMLEEHTLKTVRFKTFTLSADGGAVTLSMGGEARGFNAVAYQSEVFTGLTKEFLSPTFSNFALDEKGNVSFNFETRVNPQIILYRTALENKGGSPNDASIESGE